jgi:hypothetical protein
MSGAAPHPEMQAILLAMQEAAAPALETLPIREARDTFTQNNRAWNEPLPPVGASDATLGGVSCRVLASGACGDRGRAGGAGRSGPRRGAAGTGRVVR